MSKDANQTADYPALLRAAADEIERLQKRLAAIDGSIIWAPPLTAAPSREYQGIEVWEKGTLI